MTTRWGQGFPGCFVRRAYEGDLGWKPKLCFCLGFEKDNRAGGPLVLWVIAVGQLGIVIVFVGWDSRGC